MTLVCVPGIVKFAMKLPEKLFVTRVGEVCQTVEITPDIQPAND